MKNIQKKSTKKILLYRILLALLLIILGCQLMNYLFVVEDDWTRILWHNFYEKEENIDYLYLGSSHVYSDIDPSLLDEINGGVNYNFSSHAQKLNGSYYLLVEALKKHTPKHVFLELYYDCSTGEKGDYHHIGSTEWDWKNTDYMKFSMNKIAYELTMSSPKHYPETLLPYLRFRSDFDKLDRIADRVKAKNTDDYKNYIYRVEKDGGIMEFMENGYRYSNFVIDANDFRKDATSLSESPMSPDALKYLDKIVTLCKKQNIELTLFCSPIYELDLLSVNDYDLYYNQVKALANQYDVPFYDFNLCKSQYLPIQKQEYFADMGHLNNAGVNLFTPFFWEVAGNNASDTSYYFYDSYAQKCVSEPETLYGIINHGENPESEVSIHAVGAIYSDNLEFEIIYADNAGNETVFQEFDTNPYFTLPLNFEGTCTIRSRSLTNPDNIQTYCYTY